MERKDESLGEDKVIFSEMAKNLPKGRITRLATRLAKRFKKEFDRRMKEIEEGKALTLYRPWDDKE